MRSRVAYVSVVAFWFGFCWGCALPILGGGPRSADTPCGEGACPGGFHCASSASVGARDVCVADGKPWTPDDGLVGKDRIADGGVHGR